MYYNKAEARLDSFLKRGTSYFTNQLKSYKLNSYLLKSL